jgi:hypothetical protein
MRPIDRTRTVVALAVGALVGLSAPGFAQTTQNPATRPATPGASDAKPIVPSRSETADSAFRKLDAANRGYVSKDDVTQLSGFDQTFTQNDVNRDGRLTSDEFRKAWTTYSGYPK